MDDEAIVELRDIRKSFDANVALDGVSLSLLRAEIHGLLGGNGAGKTTLMNILYGLYRKDSGEILIRGQKVNIQSPRDAIQHKIGMVHQHFLQIGSYTVLENIVLGTEVAHRFTMNLEEEARKVQNLCERFGLQVDVKATLDTLPIGTRQKVEILKALYRGVEVLILDEPTTNLTPQEVDTLFESLREMVKEGMSIVFITHKLREVMGICDRITILREGRKITSMLRSDASEELFVRAMVGEDMNIEKSVFFARETYATASVDRTFTPILELKNLQLVSKEGVPLLKDINVAVYPGRFSGWRAWPATASMNWPNVRPAWSGRPAGVSGWTVKM